MAYPLYSGQISDYGPPIPAAFWNGLRTSLPNMLDGVRGGTYGLTGNLTIAGPGLVQIDAPLTVGHAASVALTSGTRVTLVPRLKHRVVDCGLRMAPFGTPGNYVQDDINQWTVNEVSNPMILADVHVPDACTVASVSVFYRPPSGHGGQPASMPVLTLYAQLLQTGSPAAFSLGSVTDTYGGGYETNHALLLDLGGSPYGPVDRTTARLLIGLVTEHGANALAGTIVRSVKVNYTATVIDEA